MIFITFNEKETQYESVCDETQNLNDTDSETFFRYQNFPRPVPRLFSVPEKSETGSGTFFGTKKNRDRFRDFFRYQIFFETDSDTIKKRQKSRERDETETKTTKFKSVSGTFQYQIFFAPDSETFRYQIFSGPIPRLFSVLKISGTDSETFFGTKIFRYRFRDFFSVPN